MRGLWDNEQPTSPALLRSALALAGGFLALISIAMLALAIASLFAKFYMVAALQIAFGIAVPFATWLALKMLADILVVLNRSRDRLEGIEDALTGRVSAPPRHVPDTPAAERASDDGPVYPAED